MSSKSSKTDSPSGETLRAQSLPEFVVVGRVRRPHGIRGALLVEPSTDVTGRFEGGSTLTLVESSGARRPVEVALSQSHNNGVVVHLKGVRDRDASEALRGARFEVPIADVPKGEPGFYYYFELEGCQCFDDSGGALGVVQEVVEDGGGLLLRIVAADRQLLVPFVERYLKEVDVLKGRIDFTLPEGLIEICTSKS